MLIKTDSFSQPLRTSLLAYLAIHILLLSSWAKAVGSAEDKVKTAIIYKTTKFVTWPKKKQSLTICLLGDGPINHIIQKINRKNSMGRRLSVTHKDAKAPLEKLCDAIYIHNTDKETVAKVLKNLHGHPVLTISDSRNFAEQGGMVGLKRNGKKINFHVNSRSAKAAGLTISSQLLELATVVK